ncbi:hypothetical protein D9M68_628770 [compost metagenome]
MQQPGRQRTDRGHLFLLQHLALDVDQLAVDDFQFGVLLGHLRFQPEQHETRALVEEGVDAAGRRREQQEQRVDDERPHRLDAPRVEQARQHVQQVGEQAEDQVLPQPERQRDARGEDRQVQADIVRRLHAFGLRDHPRDHDLRQQQPRQRQPWRKPAPDGAVQHHHHARDQQRHHHARHRERQLLLRILAVVEPDAEQDQHDRGIGAAAAERQAEVGQLGLVAGVELIGAHGVVRPDSLIQWWLRQRR